MLIGCENIDLCLSNVYNVHIYINPSLASIVLVVRSGRPECVGVDVDVLVLFILLQRAVKLPFASDCLIS